MKKIFLFAVGMILLLSACGGSDEAEGNPSGNGEDGKQEESAQQDKEKSEINNKVYDGEKYKFVFGDSKQVKGTRGNQILIVNVEYTNKSNEPESAWMAFSQVLKPVQETKATQEMVTGANGGIPEKMKPKIDMSTKVKSGKTINTKIALSLKYPDKPLKIFNMHYQKPKVFEKVIK